MKKFVKVMAMLAVVACVVSCRKDETIANEELSIPKQAVTLTADFEQPSGEQSSKVNYEETTGGNLHPEWELNDIVVGVDKDGNTFTLTVISVDESTGKAILSSGKETIADGKIHLIYKKGATKDDWEENKMEIGYNIQEINNDMYAVMLSDAELKDGKATCHFSNAGAVIGIVNAKNIPAGAVITRVAVYGKNLSKATIALNGESELALTPTEAEDDKIASVDLPTDGGDEIVVNDDENASLSKTIRIAVPAGATIKKVSLSTANKEIFYMTTERTVEAKKYLTVKTKEFKKAIGYFTINEDGDKVAFAPGNLYCTKNNDGTFSFDLEANQFDYRTTYMDNLSPKPAKPYGACPCVIDGVYYENMTGGLQNTSGLFQWVRRNLNTSGNNDKKVALASYGAFSNLSNDDLIGSATDVIDFAKTLNDGRLWRTLTNDEWNYMLGLSESGSVREKPDTKYSIVKFQLPDKNKTNVKGLLIYPDDYTDDFYEYDATLEAIPDGCVFIPAAGNRLTNQYNNSGVYIWGNEAAGTMFGQNPEKCAYSVSVSGSNITAFGQYRSYGRAIRLVVDVYNPE